MPSGRRVARPTLAATLLLAVLLAACVPPGAEPPDPAQAAAAREAELNRQQAEVHRQLAQGLEEAGEVEAAVQDYQAAARLDRWAVKPGAKDLSGTPIGDLERICEEGGAEGGDPAAIEQACTAAINSGRLSTPRLAVMLGRRGMARLALDDTEGAMADFRTALKIDTSDPDILLARAGALERAGNPKGALADYSIALLRAPERADLRFARARLRTAIGDHQGAAADYDRILSNPEAVAAHPEAYGERALAHCRMGRAEAAEIGWQVWIDTVPEGVDALEDRLWASGYLRPPRGDGFGLAEQAALRVWTKAGCPDNG
jgi:tetratricopeptide (TPR) repeat protein